MDLDVHLLRQEGAHHDRAVVDLLHLRQLGLAPGYVKTADLMRLWSCSQPNVSRRMAAIHDLGIVTVVSTWGRYRVVNTPPAARRVRREPLKAEELASRWEEVRRRLREVLA